MRKLSWRDALVPVVLLLLSVVPMLGGAARLVSLTGPPTASDARFFGSPIPVVIHILTASIYAVGGAFLFSAGVRSRWPGWHRRAGKIVAVCGLSAALAGVWMTARYTIPTDLQGPILYTSRLLAGAAMTAAILLAWSSILRRDFARHEAWMVRGYALAQGAGTQAVVLAGWWALSGEPVALTRDVLMTGAWILNLVIAECIIRARSRRSRMVVAELSLRSARA